MERVLRVGKVGYAGRDPLRENAEKMMRGEMKSKVYSPASNSSVQNEKMMPYRKGGPVRSVTEKTVESSPVKRGHRIPTDLHIPKLEKYHQPAEKKVTALKKAGGPMTREKTVATYKAGGSNELTVNKRHGGCMTEKVVNHKRGGEHKKHFGWGGGFGNMIKGIPLIGNLASMIGMKEGGDMKKRGGCMKKAEGGDMKKAAGGSIYQRQMMGEKKASSAPHANYEAEMRGEHAVKKAFAKGGVGKIRHEAMTMSGKPKAPKKP